jgi:predicted adenine nucleotide alpha hydrolase (AANH) superfamily ATPase
LTISPHKNAQAINNIGSIIEEETGLKFLFSDFKKKEGFKRSIQLSNEFSLYRQEYCGCEFSKKITKI